jgi:subtilisin
MAITVTFRVVDPVGNPVSGLGRLHGIGPSGEWASVTSFPGPDGALSFTVDPQMKPQVLNFTAEAPGFWAMAFPQPQPVSAMRCEELPSSDQQPWWWHLALNCQVPDRRAGEGIKIGVIDTDFARRDGLENVGKIEDIWEPTLSETPIENHSQAKPTHGEIICRIIAQPDYGLAPAADLRSVVVDTPEGKLNAVQVYEAIRYLAQDWGADVINLSAGLFDNPLLALRSAIRLAGKVGTLCVVAAGNEASEAVAFPARYQEATAVGAIGLVDWGPRESVVHRYGKRTEDPDALGASICGQNIFHFPLSAFGEGLDVVAPGVGIVVNRGAQSLFAATGTSYAAPMVCGLLARVLSEDREYQDLPRSQERCDAARKILHAMCKPTGMAGKYEGRGMPWRPGNSRES